MADFDVAKFRQQFQAFKDETAYPTPTIEFKAVLARGYVSEGCTLKGEVFEAAWSLMVAHLLWIDKMLAAGQTQVQVTTGATVGSVSVTAMAPPARTGWQYWLATTPFGEQLWAFLMMRAAGGWYVGGSPERSAFRGVAGRFGGRRPL